MAWVLPPICSRYRRVSGGRSWPCSSCKYPEMAVKGVRRSWEMFTTASFSSLSPCWYRSRSCRRARSSSFKALASRRSSLSRQGRESSVLVSCPRRSTRSRRSPFIPWRSRATFIPSPSATRAKPAANTQTIAILLSAPAPQQPDSHSQRQQQPHHRPAAKPFHGPILHPSAGRWQGRYPWSGR